MFTHSYFLTLLITLVVETSIALLFGFRDKLSVASVTLVNLITNPILNYILWLNFSLRFMNINTLNLTLMEAVVVVVEALLLTYSLRKSWKRILLLSIVMNAVSFTIGLLFITL